MLIKQNIKILKFNYENLEAFSAVVNNNTEEKSEFKKETISSYSFKLIDFKNINITMKQLIKEQQNSNEINIIKDFNNILIND